MEELVKLVAQKTGLSEEKAKVAVETVLGFLQERLPGPVVGQIESLLEGEGAGGLGNVAKGLGGILGKKG
jgi:hypothetical protein